MIDALLAWVVDGVAIAVVATVAARLMPADAPSRRHAFWWMVLAAVVAVPWMPSALDAPAAAMTGVTIGLSRPAAEISAKSLLAVPALPASVVTGAAVLWAASIALSLIALAQNVFATRRLARNSRLLPLKRTRFPRFDAARCSSRSVRVCVSDDIRGACAVGFRRPRILVSSALLTTLDDEAIEAILLHEYAHLQRYDDWASLLQRVVCAGVGWHPAVWWASRHIDVEREAACDRAVVALTGAPLVYARALTLAAEVVMRGGAFTPLAAPGASISGAGFHARVVRVLSTRASSPLHDWGSAALGIASLAMAVSASTYVLPIVVTSAPTRRLAELSSVAVAPGVMNSLPASTQRALTRPMDGTPVRPRTRPETISPLAENVRQPITMVRAPVNEPETHAVAEASLSDARPIAVQISMPGEARAAIVSPWIAEADSNGIGARASRAGAATRDASVKAGLSVGRWFKRSGLAVADRF